MKVISVRTDSPHIKRVRKGGPCKHCAFVGPSDPMNDEILEWVADGTLPCHEAVPSCPWTKNRLCHEQYHAVVKARRQGSERADGPPVVQ